MAVPSRPYLRLHHVISVAFALVATLIATGSPLALAQLTSVQSETLNPLSVVDISLIAPHEIATCDPAYIRWQWNDVGTPPSDAIALSIINASSFGISNARRRASRRHFDSAAAQSIVFAKRATIRGTILDGAASLPFNEVSYRWPQANVLPGQYRLLLTIVATGQAVVSDPFVVTLGASTSCLDGTQGSAADGISTGSATQSPFGSLTSTTPAVADQTTPSSPESSAPAPVNTVTDTGAAPSSSIDPSPGVQSASQQAGTPKRTNHGAIAAGVIVPLMAIIAGIYAYRLWKRRGGTGTSRPAWTEKFFASGDGRAPDHKSSPSHRRQISSPQLASAAGMAAVAQMVPQELRQEKDESALRALPHPCVPPQSPEQVDCRHADRPDDHWIDFADSDVHGARPLSDGTIEHRGHQLATLHSAAQARDANVLNANTFYHHGHNVPLRPPSQHLSICDDSVSSFGTPAERLSAQSQASLGRDLIAALPQPPASSPQETPPHQQTSLQRSDSSGSQFGIKRKPVPHWSITADKQSADDSHDAESDNPFSNANAVAAMVPRDTVGSVDDEAEVLDTDAAYADHVLLDRYSKAESSEEPLHKISITAVADARAETPCDAATDSEASPRRQQNAHASGSTVPEERQQYHLSVNLSRTSGFLVKFD
ncbi:unnamed protein product [Parajaminaea phylloscopi]